jgi:hypothetical protein
LDGGRLAHYRIISRLGAGGMGEVYRARDEQLDRDVAVKVLPTSSFDNPTVRARLMLSIVSSLIVPGGLFTRMFGHAVVTRRGSEIGRARSLTRVLIAWAPAIAWLLYLASSPRVQGFVPTPTSPMLGALITLAALGIGAVFTSARPERGPHDWLLGTFVVPRQATPTTTCPPCAPGRARSRCRSIPSTRHSGCSDRSTP